MYVFIKLIFGIFSYWKICDKFFWLYFVKSMRTVYRVRVRVAVRFQVRCRVRNSVGSRIKLKNLLV